jgi:hypothetical protein
MFKRYKRLKLGSANIEKYYINGNDESGNYNSIFIKLLEKSKDIFYYEIDISHNKNGNEISSFIIDNSQINNESIKFNLLRFMFIDIKGRIYEDEGILEYCPKSNLIKLIIAYIDQEAAKYCERIISWKYKSTVFEKIMIKLINKR